MVDNTKSVLCGACRVALKGPANPDPQDVFSCPSCGRADSFDNVMASVKAFIVELTERRLEETMRKAARGSKVIKVTGKPVQKGNHPFIADVEL
ncbi:hypothetical protein [Pacificoceanicola onchidii]|uniref:hypothetical protein n=1 Tax=Pacificoceanicola onchidii TaxID=2562685 RepID=UPI0010A6669B|nr:hypothetical protein [Pacificoceanicola onchidii]